MRGDATAYPELAALETRGDMAELIRQVREAVVADPAGALADPVVQAWLARRWTALVVQRAALDEQAVATARERAHGLEPLEAVARRFVTRAPSEAPGR
jgi:hypothetical protein